MELIKSKPSTWSVKFKEFGLEISNVKEGKISSNEYGVKISLKSEIEFEEIEKLFENIESFTDCEISECATYYDIATNELVVKNRVFHNIYLDEIKQEGRFVYNSIEDKKEWRETYTINFRKKQNRSRDDE